MHNVKLFTSFGEILLSRKNIDYVAIENVNCRLTANYKAAAAFFVMSQPV
jgi:hypothetical protein